MALSQHLSKISEQGLRIKTDKQIIDKEMNHLFIFFSFSSGFEETPERVSYLVNKMMTSGNCIWARCQKVQVQQPRLFFFFILVYKLYFRKLLFLLVVNIPYSF